ncbi:MAG: DUF2480 family protein [Flavobacteriales bacterium]|nr:DUF2480 family protein [Flavobacteriales bacterium]
MDEIVNKVAQSGLINLDIKDLRPKGERVLIDLKDVLWQGMALKEKDFRAYIKETDWSVYQDKFVAIQCSVDAIIPSWAYMLLGTALEGIAKTSVIGDLNRLEETLFKDFISSWDVSKYKNERLIIKGCSDVFIPRSAYFQISEKLKPTVKSLMFGEPCSTVPVYKAPKQ